MESKVADGGVMTFGNDINSAGTYVTHLTLTPNATVTSSTATFAGKVSVADSLIPDTSGGADIGSTSAEWGNIFIADDKMLKFGSDQDWTVEYDEDGDDDLVLTGSDISIESSTSSKPILSVLNTNADANGATLKFNKNGSSPATNDIVGNIDFVSEDAGNAVTTYGRIQSTIVDVTAGGEQGGIDFFVAENDGTLTKGMAIAGASSDGDITVDISTHDGTAGGLKLGGTLVTATAAELNLLDGETSLAGVTLSGSTNNTVATVTGSNALAGEANLTFDGSALAVTGTVTATSTIQGTTITATTAFAPDASGGADIGTTSLEFGDVFIADDKYVQFGSDQNVLMGYDETTTDSLRIAATEGAALAITLMADEGDDAGDEWKLNIADGGVLTLGNDINSAGTYVTHLTITPNSTASSSTTAFAGNVTAEGAALSSTGKSLILGF